MPGDQFFDHEHENQGYSDSLWWDVRELPNRLEVPYEIDILPDGREAVVIGDVEGVKKFNHHQGDNPYGFRGTCGLVSCQEILNQFGLEVTEADVVDWAVKNGLCSVTDNPATSGGTTLESQARILSDFGVSAEYGSLSSLEELAQGVEEGKGIIIAVNAERLWGQPSFWSNNPNHAIVVTGVARNPKNGKVEGIYINDSGRSYRGDSGRFIDAKLLKRCWLNQGGNYVMTHYGRTYSPASE